MELRIERERAVVRFASEPLAPGVAVEQLSIEVPRPGAHVDVGAGPSQFRHSLCDLDGVELAVAPDALASAVRDRVRSADLGLAGLEVALGEGFVELAGRTPGGAGFTCRIAPATGDDDAVRVGVVDARLHARSSTSSAALAARIAAALAPAGRASGSVATLSPLRDVLLQVLPRRGFKLPRTGSARVASAQVSPDGARLAWARWSGPAALPGDPELAAALDGARAFPAPEAALDRGDEAAALGAWLGLPAAARAHPFAATRILSLLCCDPQRRSQARSAARDWLARDPRATPALVAEGVLSAEAEDAVSASRAFAALATLSRARGLELAVLAAADACAALGGQADPAALERALAAALEVRRRHVPALRALHDLGRRTLDRATLLRACRGLAAHSSDAREKARAHARLAVLLAAEDAAAARLHLANALRLGPDEPETRDAAARLRVR